MFIPSPDVEAKLGQLRELLKGSLFHNAQQIVSTVQSLLDMLLGDNKAQKIAAMKEEFASFQGVTDVIPEIKMSLPPLPPEKAAQIETLVAGVVTTAGLTPAQIAQLVML